MDERNFLQLDEDRVSFDVVGYPDVRYFSRNPVGVVEYLLQQKAYEEHLVYAPVKLYNDNQSRIYTEMYTAEWWRNEQVSDIFEHKVFVRSHNSNSPNWRNTCSDCFDVR